MGRQRANVFPSGLRIATLFTLSLFAVACTDAASPSTEEGTPTATRIIVPTRPVGRLLTPTPSAEGAPVLTLVPGQATTRPVETLNIAPPPPGRTFEGLPPDPGTGRPRTAIYDIEGGGTIDLGPGTTGAFSPDSRHMTWATWRPDARGTALPDQVWVIDLHTFEKRFLGEGTGPGFWNNEEVLVTIPDPSGRANLAEKVLIDIETGARQPRGARRDSVRTPPITHHAELTDAVLQASGDGYVVRELATSKPLFRFDAFSASRVDGDTILVTVGRTPSGGSGYGPFKDYSIYLVRVSTQAVTYIATYPECQVLDANPDYVAWTDGNWPNGGVLVYERATGRISRLSEYIAPRFAANGMLGDGFAGFRKLIDLKTRQYHAILPTDGTGTVFNWSPDFRFATSGDKISTAGTC
jgi:hypothetical protein